jgi:hypothetical protein
MEPLPLLECRDLDLLSLLGCCNPEIQLFSWIRAGIITLIFMSGSLNLWLCPFKVFNMPLHSLLTQIFYFSFLVYIYSIFRDALLVGFSDKARSLNIGKQYLHLSVPPFLRHVCLSHHESVEGDGPQLVALKTTITSIICLSMCGPLD